MIKLQELLGIKKMVYSESIKPKHKNTKIVTKVALVNSLERYLFIIEDLIIIFNTNSHI